jgi:phage terminase large subunit-like protein
MLKKTVRDYVDIANAYAQEAIADTGNKKFNKWIRLAASRYLKDKLRAASKKSPFLFSNEMAKDACGFIEKLPHVEGKWFDKDGNPAPYLILHPSHIFFIVNLFGFRNHDGTRRFTTALLAIARKNAKSTLSAAILIYCLCCEDEPGAQVISAATTRDQAQIIFKIAKRMIEMSPDLRDAFNLETFSSAITNWGAGSNFRPIAAKASTQDGLNPSHTGLDEIHAHKNSDLLNVLESAAGARLNVLWLYTTTEGYESAGPWSEMRLFSQHVLNEVLEADHFFVLFYGLDVQIGKRGDKDYRPADDEFDENNWKKANPLIEVNPILLREIKKQSLEAKQMPSKHSEFKIKRCNLAASVANGWVNLSKWKACSGEVALNSLEKVPCYGGLDLSFTNDIAAFRLTWVVDNQYYTYGWRFVPKVSIKRRTEKGLVPVQAWVDAGHLIVAGEDIIDYDVIFDTIMHAMNRFNIQSIGYDDWNVKQILKKLEEENVPMQEFRQGGKTYHPAMKLLEEVYITGRLHHGGDPVLTWNAANLVARTDQNMNNAPDKRKSSEKIDDMVALIMSFGVSIDTVLEPGVDSWLKSE